MSPSNIQEITGLIIPKNEKITGTDYMIRSNLEYSTFILTSPPHQGLGWSLQNASINRQFLISPTDLSGHFGLTGSEPMTSGSNDRWQSRCKCVDIIRTIIKFMTTLTSNNVAAAIQKPQLLVSNNFFLYWYNKPGEFNVSLLPARGPCSRIDW